MSKEKIPVYDICSLSKDTQKKQNDLLVERFGAYLNRHEHSLHHAHRHRFFKKYVGVTPDEFRKPLMIH